MFQGHGVALQLEAFYHYAYHWWTASSWQAVAMFQYCKLCSKEVAALLVSTSCFTCGDKLLRRAAWLTALVLSNGPLPALRSLFGPTFTPLTAGHLALQLRIGRKKDVLPIGLLRLCTNAPGPCRGACLPPQACCYHDVIAGQTLAVGGTCDRVLMLMMQNTMRFGALPMLSYKLKNAIVGRLHSCCSHPSQFCGGTGSLWFVALW